LNVNIIERLIEVFNEPYDENFNYNVGQSVRVLRNLEVNVHAIRHLLGTKGTVIDRYTTALRKENKYIVKFPKGDTETFDEDELDKRFIRRKIR